MRSYQLPIALLGFLAFVAVVPAWMYFNGNYTLRPESSFLAALVLPAAALLFITSWIKPDLAAPILGVFTLVGIMVLAPWFWTFTGMVSSQLTSSPLAQITLQAAVPLLIVAYIASMGYNRIRT